MRNNDLAQFLRIRPNCKIPSEITPTLLWTFLRRMYLLFFKTKNILQLNINYKFQEVGMYPEVFWIIMVLIIPTIIQDFGSITIRYSMIKFLMESFSRSMCQKLRICVWSSHNFEIYIENEIPGFWKDTYLLTGCPGANIYISICSER